MSDEQDIVQVNLRIPRLVWNVLDGVAKREGVLGVATLARVALYQHHSKDLKSALDGVQKAAWRASQEQGGASSE